jgi:urease accessory protein
LTARLAERVMAARGTAHAPDVSALDGTFLQFAVDAERRTYIKQQRASYPYHLTRPFYLDGASSGAASVYLQSLSGGLVQGDRVRLHLSAGEGSVAHVTTQSATKVHSMERGLAHQRIELEIGDQAHLEYIADPTISFPRARLVAETELCVAEGASAILGDSYLWHDPRGSSELVVDFLSVETRIRRPDGRIVALDRSRLSSARGLNDSPALLGPYRAFGSVFAIGRGSDSGEVISSLRTALGALADVYIGVSRLPSDAGLCARILAHDGASLKRAMTTAWRHCHEEMLGWAPAVRRK